MIGRVLGSYRIVRELGRGGMGTVYLAEYTLLGREAAIKVLRPELSTNHALVTRFFNEARAATAIRHLGIVEVYDFGYDDDGVAFIVMEYLRGESLARRIGRRRLEPTQALTVIRQIAAPLAAAHRAGIVHRDLKPDNVFIVADDEAAGGERMKLLDFGVAKLSAQMTSGEHAQSGVIVGTPTYMAPEQCRGVAIDHRADLYSLGCILYRLLCGVPPFSGEGVGDILTGHIHLPPPSPSEKVPGLDPAIDELVVRLLAKRPEERPRSAEELVRAIDAIVGPVREVSGDGAAATTPTPTTTAEPGLELMSTVGSGTVTGASQALTVGTARAASAGPSRARWLLAGGAAAALVGAVVAVFVLSGPGRGASAPAGPAPSSEVNGTSAAATGATTGPVPVAAPPVPPAPPPAPPPEVETVAVALDSAPRGAAVIVDGREVGTTPFTARWPRSLAPVEVALVRKGYQTERLSLVPSDAIDRTLTLTRARRAAPPARPQPPAPPAGGLTPTNPFPR